MQVKTFGQLMAFNRKARRILAPIETNPALTISVHAHPRREIEFSVSIGPSTKRGRQFEDAYQFTPSIYPDSVIQELKCAVRDFLKTNPLKQTV